MSDENNSSTEDSNEEKGAPATSVGERVSRLESGIEDTKAEFYKTIDDRINQIENTLKQTNEEINKSIDERVWNLERDLKNANSEILELKKKPKIWKDRSFYSGIFALPLLILGGWVLTFVGGASDSRFFQPLPYVHTMFGTEEAFRAYISPDKKRDQRQDVPTEISGIITQNFAPRIDQYIEDRDLLSTTRLEELLNGGEMDDKIKSIVGRQQNFNDFYVSRLGLIPESAERRDCTNIPSGAEILSVETTEKELCFLIGNSFAVSDSFSILRPKDVNTLHLEIFVVPREVDGVDDAGIKTRPFSVEGSIRNKILEVRVGKEKAPIKHSAVEGAFALETDAYKYTADVEVPITDDDEDRSYDILNLSLNLLNYDTLLQSEKRDKTFMIFIVPTFLSS